MPKKKKKKVKKIKTAKVGQRKKGKRKADDPKKPVKQRKLGYGESASVKEARKRAEAIDSIVTCWDLSYTVAIFVEDGKFNFYPDALAMTWKGFYFVFQEHQPPEVYCKDEVAQIHQYREKQIKPDDNFLRDLKLRVDQVANVLPETIKNLLED